VEVVVLWFGVAYWLIRMPEDSSESAVLLICRAGNSCILEPILYLNRLITGRVLQYLKKEMIRKSIRLNIGKVYDRIQIKSINGEKYEDNENFERAKYRIGKLPKEYGRFACVC
jgi:hypothetical protein